MWPEAEAIERAALEDLHAAAEPDLKLDLGLSKQSIGTGLASLAKALPASAIVVNRTLGLGLDRPASRESVEAIVDAYAQAAIERYFIHLHPSAEPAELADWLQALGLERARAWVKFERGREAPPEIETDLAIRPARPADGDAFGRIVANAFDLGDPAAPWMARLIRRPGWHIYMSFEAGQPAGAGTPFVRDGVGWLDWGATAPAFRGRGSQSAILARRILDALDLGCRHLVTATGEEAHGDPQHSYKNIMRMGFRPTYLRLNYAPPRPV